MATETVGQTLAGAGKTDSDTESSLRLLKAACESDLFLFTKHILGFSDLSVDPHKKICDFISADTHRHKMLLLPRGSFKTSIATVAYPIWRLIKNPDLRVLICNERVDNAVTFLGGIKSILESNPMFHALYGDWMKSDEWTKSEITIRHRKRWDIREPSVACAGLGVVKVGMHSDLNILDDLHSEKNTTSKEIVDKVIDHYKLMSAILEPGGQTVVVGTRWHEFDLYEWILENEKDAFDVIVERAERPDGSLFFPSRLNRDFLDTQRKRMGPWLYSMQYLNEPVNDETARFKKSWLKSCWYRKEDMPKFTDWCLIVDPAISTGVKSDYSAFVIVQMDSKGDIWIGAADRHKLEAHEIIDKIFDYASEWPLRLIAVETNVFQKFLKFALKNEMGRRRLFVPVREVRSSTRQGKDYRISAIAPAFEGGQIRIAKDMHDLIDEYLRYPKAAHDDLLDALSYAPEVLRPMLPEIAAQEKSIASFYTHNYEGT